MLILFNKDECTKYVNYWEFKLGQWNSKVPQRCPKLGVCWEKGWGKNKMNVVFLPCWCFNSSIILLSVLYLGFWSNIVIKKSGPTFRSTGTTVTQAFQGNIFAQNIGLPCIYLEHEPISVNIVLKSRHCLPNPPWGSNSLSQALLLWIMEMYLWFSSMHLCLWFISLTTVAPNLETNMFKFHFSEPQDFAKDECEEQGSGKRTDGPAGGSPMEETV